MPTRIREITDPFGMRLRVSIHPDPHGALIALERSDVAGAPRVMLDSYGGELLSGFIMAARLALPHPLPDEACSGRHGAELCLTHEPAVAIKVRQAHGEGAGIDIPAPFWDKLYAELCLVLPHARQYGRGAGTAVLVH
ncbi:MAG TPA: hypothetical protein VGB62_03605 [Allosphingosinicella sp.]